MDYLGLVSLQLGAVYQTCLLALHFMMLQFAAKMVCFYSDCAGCRGHFETFSKSEAELKRGLWKGMDLCVWEVKKKISIKLALSLDLGLILCHKLQPLLLRKHNVLHSFPQHFLWFLFLLFFLWLHHSIIHQLREGSKCCQNIVALTMVNAFLLIFNHQRQSKQ